ncbi:DUF1987 domain-containing protein [Aquibaculum sediminis]|uniref:DUF1987 domain-containing protein n=1 Tax=Aquibaculum sediminis TaxID=3231907 RepID=UPI003452DFE3
MTSDPKIIEIPSGERSPYICFDFTKGRMKISGESYPEDAAAFFGPLLKEIEDQLSAPGPDLVLDLNLAYFNSSSAKALMNIFQMLEDAAAQGRKVSINWHYHNDDDTMEEFGHDFAEDFQHVNFALQPYS